MNKANNKIGKLIRDIIGAHRVIYKRTTTIGKIRLRRNVPETSHGHPEGVLSGAHASGAYEALEGGLVLSSRVRQAPFSNATPRLKMRNQSRIKRKDERARISRQRFAHCMRLSLTQFLSR